jgi:lysophospholipase L1-like esterase
MRRVPLTTTGSSTCFAHREQPFVDQVVDLPGSADALSIAASGGLLFVGRRHSTEKELLVLQPDGTIAGTLDLPQPIKAITVSGGQLRASSARSTYVVDVGDPAHPTLLATVPRDAAPRPPLAVAQTVDFVVDAPFAYVASRFRYGDLQQIDLDLPFSFPDADGDGVWRLGCLGDSNTEPSDAGTHWCEKLVALIDDPRFAVVNLAIAGATAITTNQITDAALQVTAALDPALHLDAAILAFGTNDTNLVAFSPDPALFDTQITAIADAIEEHATTLASAGLAVYVATTPPRWKALFGPDGYNERILAVNDAIRARFPAAALIDFYKGFHPDTSEISDGVHLNQRGHVKRACRALRVLRR